MQTAAAGLRLCFFCGTVAALGTCICSVSFHSHVSLHWQHGSCANMVAVRVIRAFVGHARLATACNSRAVMRSTAADFTASALLSSCGCVAMPSTCYCTKGTLRGNRLYLL
jgi:hypothetical protein